MNTASRKAKGRRLQYKVRDDLRAMGKSFGLKPEDVESRPMGSQGVDLMLSSRAREIFPFQIECKNCESLNVWKIFQEHYEKHKQAHGIKMLIHSKNHSEPLVTLRWKDFMDVFDIPEQ